MVFLDYKNQRILYYRHLGKSYAEITCRLIKEERRATKVGVLKFLRRYEQTGTLSHKPGTGKALKMTDIMNKQLALLLHLVLRPVRIFTTLVALPVSTPKCFIDYIRIRIRIDIRLW